MSTTASEFMTTEELLALPEDGMDRELIRGVLKVKPMTKRNRRHSRTESRISHLLEQWLETQADPRGEVVVGEAGFRLQRDPDTTVGLDVAYVAPEVSQHHQEATYFEGPPVLAVEILSPSDTQEDIDEKVVLYLETGVKIVWIVNPRFKTVTVYRSDVAPAFFHESQTIDAEPHLPGFRVPVRSFF